MLGAHGCSIRAPALPLLGVEDPWVEGEEEGEEEGTGILGFPTFQWVGRSSSSPQFLQDHGLWLEKWSPVSHPHLQMGLPKPREGK